MKTHKEETMELKFDAKGVEAIKLMGELHAIQVKFMKFSGKKSWGDAEYTVKHIAQEAVYDAAGKVKP
jgi:hypothetical protein